MLSLLGGLAAGSTEGQAVNAAADRQSRMDQIQLDRAARDSEQYAREKSMQGELDAAAAPTTTMVKPDTADNIDVGTDPTAAPTAVTTPKSLADVQAAQQRVVQKYDPAKGMQMQAAQMSVQAEQTKVANDVFDQGVNKAAAGGWDSLMKYMNDSSASPAQHRAIPNTEDGGKTVKIMTVNPDGSLVPTGQVYNADTAGVMTAAEMLTRGTPITAKVAHYLAEKRNDIAEQRQARLEDHNITMENIGQQRADAYDRSVDAARNGGSKGGFDKLPESDKMTLQDLNKRGEQISASRVKLASDPTFDESSDAGKRTIATLDKMERDIQIQKRALALKADGLSGAADPMGRSTPSGSPAPASRGGSRSLIQPGDSDFGRILNTEYATEKRNAAGLGPNGNDPEFVARAKVNMAAIEKEAQGKRVALSAATPAPLPAATAPVKQSAQANQGPPPAVISTADGRPMPAPQSMGAVAAEKSAKAAVAPTKDVGTTLDAARTAFAAAREALLRFGSKQKQSDPAGFIAAQRALEAAKAARDAAQTAYESSVSGENTKAAFGLYPKPF